MRKSLENFGKYIPPSNPGYDYIKKTKVFIPYLEFGINILERTETRLSLIYETVLNLIEVGITDVIRISEILGIDLEIFREVIAELSRSELIDVSDMTLILKEKGRIALQELKKVSINRSQINRVFLNTITGIFETYDLNQLVERPDNGYIYLNFEEEYDIEFIKANFSQIDNIYSKNIKSNELETSIQNSLYRIIDIAYQSLKFKGIDAFIYLNQDDSSLAFTFEEDPKGQYSAQVLQQIKRDTPNVQSLYERDYNLISSCKCKKTELDQLMVDNLKALITEVNKKMKGIINESEMESHYLKDRYLLDGEIEDILQDFNYYKPKEIIISSPHMLAFLHNNYIKNMLIQGLPRTKIIIVYNSSEYKISDQISWIKSKIKRSQNIKFVNSGQFLTETTIIYSPNFVIRTNYEIFQDRCSRYITKEISHISFNYNKIQEAIKSLNINIKEE